jgi:hypothetical protein
MQTNFFRQLAKMNLSGDLQITIRPTEENSFVLSVLLNVGAVVFVFLLRAVGFFPIWSLIAFIRLLASGDWLLAVRN